MFIITFLIVELVSWLSSSLLVDIFRIGELILILLKSVLEESKLSAWISFFLFTFFIFYTIIIIII